MSWDVVLIKLPPEVVDISEMPHDWMPDSFGALADVRQRLLEVRPDADLGEHFGQLSRDGYSIQLALIADDAGEVLAIDLEVRGTGHDVVGVIRAIAEYLGLAAVDGSLVLRFDGDAEASFDAWQAFRDRVVTRNR